MNKDPNNPICYFAETNFRTTRKRFGIFMRDRMYHFYIIGRSGAGKSTLLNTKMKNDIIQNNGFCLIDPHADLVRNVLEIIPPYKQDDVLYLDASSTTTLGYNPLRKVSYEKRALVASSILEIFERIWGKQGWGVKLSHLLRNAILCLCDQPPQHISKAKDTCPNNRIWSSAFVKGSRSNLQLKDVDFERRTLFVRQGKNYKDRIIPMNDNIYKALQHYIYNFRNLQKPTHDYLFLFHKSTLSKMLKKLQQTCENPNIKNKRLSLHILRHSIATHLLQNGMDIENISRFLGHSSLDSTQLYTHIVNR